MLRVIKRDGRISEFNVEKITNAIKKAANDIQTKLEEKEVSETVKKVVAVSYTHLDYVNQYVMSYFNYKMMERLMQYTKKYQMG